jgi:hypothetical protein
MVSEMRKEPYMVTDVWRGWQNRSPNIREQWSVVVWRSVLNPSVTVYCVRAYLRGIYHGRRYHIWRKVWLKPKVVRVPAVVPVTEPYSFSTLAQARKRARALAVVVAPYGVREWHRTPTTLKPICCQMDCGGRCKSS